MNHSVVQTNKQEEENRLLASIIESSDIIIYSLDKKGLIMTWNAAAEIVFGFSKKDVIGKNIKKLLPEEDEKEMEISLAKVFQGEVIRSIEATHCTKNKKLIPVGMKISPIRGADSKIIGASITARDLRREINFREKEKFLLNVSQFLNASLDYTDTLRTLAKLLVPRFSDWCAIHITEPDSKYIKLALTYSGDIKDIPVYKEESFTETPKYIEIGANTVIKTKRPLMYSSLSSQSKIGTKIQESQFALMKKLGISSVIVVPLISRGAILGTITLVSKHEDKQFEKEDFELAKEIGQRAGPAIDNAILFENAQIEIQARKIIANELQKSKNQLQIILENISDGITVHDENGKSIFVNDAIAKASGYSSAKDMIENPNNWVDRFTLLDEDGKEFSRAQIPTAMVRNGERFAQSNIHYVDKKTGESFWSQVKAQGVYDENDKLQFIVTVIHDVTEMQEQEVRKDEFISMASHELKTPLTSLVVYLHLLKSRLKNDDENMHLISKIGLQTNKLNELVSELLDISKIQSGKLDYAMEKFELDEVVEDVTQAVQGITSKHTIEINGDRDVQVFGDKNRINQVLTNLLVNAIKYSPDGGKISVDTEKNGKFVKVKVKDQGIGISVKDQEKIFEKLYQAGNSKEKTFPGLGIGLYIASNIIKRHGGTIDVKSQKGKGATFTFTVPLFSKTYGKQNYIHN